ncbi:type III polyketide synthase, partial [Salmonella enterica subsp. enterica serovar Paratyphi B]|nr:type III polyketide synthase [Salmonella enterica subsp. enterica serovar Paratyphi B]
RRALDADPDVTPADVTHVITVSCTGFHAPGPEYQIVRQLGLSDAVQRYHLGFMGCYASMPALRAARQFCLADPDAVVLVVSVELCTLHLRSSED